MSIEYKQIYSKDQISIPQSAKSSSKKKRDYENINKQSITERISRDTKNKNANELLDQIKNHIQE